MATSDFIAKNVNTHPARIRKVMIDLRKKGYLTTKEGIGGGYLLNCNITEVDLAQLYRLTSKGSLKPSWSSGDTQDTCPVASNISDVMDQIYSRTEEQVEAYLETITIDEVYEQIKQRRNTIC